MKYKAILFDMDGVLIDSEWLMRDTAIQSLAEHGVQAKHEDFREFTGMGEDRFIGGVAEKYGLKYEFFMKERAYDYFGQRVMEETEVPEGVKDMLETIHSRGIKMAVCSAADRRKVLYNLMAIGVSEDLFRAIITGSDVERKKPFPDIYLKGAAAVGEQPGDCLVIEDAVSGIKAGQAAGMDTVGIPTTFSQEELRERVNPTYVLNAIKELADLPELQR